MPYLCRNEVMTRGREPRDFMKYGRIESVNMSTASSIIRNPGVISLTVTA
jgi:hypothetical protein